MQANQAMIVDECSVLRTQVESMGNNLCRFEMSKGSLENCYQLLVLGAVNAVLSASEEKVVWSMAMRGPRDPITLPN